jgi:hypothetical protein
MMFDKELMFAEGEELTAFTSGTLGSPIDLGTKGALRGRECTLAIVARQDLTATGDPDITLTLEASDTDDFAAVKTIPLSIPTVHKADLAEGKSVMIRMPFEAGQYLRLHMEAASAVACGALDAGIVLDPQIGVGQADE